MKRNDKKNRAKDTETEELEQPVFDERGAGNAEAKDSVEEGQPVGGAGKTRGDLEQAGEDVDEESIPLSWDHSYSLDAATDTQFPGLNEGAEVVMDEIEHYTDDDDVLQDFAERQMMNNGRDELIERLQNHHSKSPGLSAGDIDARWEDTDVSGEESVGGTVVTPDQDVVDELGAALGLDYFDNEPLATADKLDARDRNRWELNPASMETELDADEDDLESILEDDLDDDLDEDFDVEKDDDLEEDLEDELPDENEDELDLDSEDIAEDIGADEELDDDEDDEGYDLKDLEDELDEDLDEFLDEDLNDDDEDD